MFGLLGFLFDGNSCYRDIVVKYMELTQTKNTRLENCETISVSIDLTLIQ